MSKHRSRSNGSQPARVESVTIQLPMRVLGVLVDIREAFPARSIQAALTTAGAAILKMTRQSCRAEARYSWGAWSRTWTHSSPNSNASCFVT